MPITLFNTGRLRADSKAGLFNFVYDSLAKEVKVLTRFEVGNGKELGGGKDGVDISTARQHIATALQNAIIEWLPDRQSRAGLQISLLGLCRSSIGESGR